MHERDVTGTLPGNVDTDGDGIPEGPSGENGSPGSSDPLDPCDPNPCDP